MTTWCFSESVLSAGAVAAAERDEASIENVAGSISREIDEDIRMGAVIRIKREAFFPKGSKPR